MMSHNDKFRRIDLCCPFAVFTEAEYGSMNVVCFTDEISSYQNEIVNIWTADTEIENRDRHEDDAFRAVNCTFWCFEYWWCSGHSIATLGLLSALPIGLD
jgi:hypothetical protein